MPSRRHGEAPDKPGWSQPLSTHVASARASPGATPPNQYVTGTTALQPPQRRHPASPYAHALVLQGDCMLADFGIRMTENASTAGAKSTNGFVIQSEAVNSRYYMV